MAQTCPPFRLTPGPLQATRSRRGWRRAQVAGHRPASLLPERCCWRECGRRGVPSPRHGPLGFGCTATLALVARHLLETRVHGGTSCLWTPRASSGFPWGHFDRGEPIPAQEPSTVPGEAPILAQNTTLWTVLVEIDNACTQKGLTVSVMSVPQATKLAFSISAGLDGVCTSN